MSTSNAWFVGMSDSDSPDDKKTGKPLTARQQLRSLLTGLLDEEGRPPKDRMTTKERAELEEMRKALNESRVDETQAKDFLEQLRGNLAKPGWAEKAKKKNSPGSGYVM